MSSKSKKRFVIRAEKFISCYHHRQPDCMVEMVKYVYVKNGFRGCFYLLEANKKS